jgi:hypothetical protein
VSSRSIRCTTGSCHRRRDGLRIVLRDELAAPDRLRIGRALDGLHLRGVVRGSGRRGLLLSPGGGRGEQDQDRYETAQRHGETQLRGYPVLPARRRSASTGRPCTHILTACGTPSRRRCRSRRTGSCPRNACSTSRSPLPGPPPGSAWSWRMQAPPLHSSSSSAPTRPSSWRPRASATACWSGRPGRSRPMDRRGRLPTRGTSQSPGACSGKGESIEMPPAALGLFLFGRRSLGEGCSPAGPPG